MMSTLSLAVITLAVIAVTPVTSVTHDDAVHVGCFSTNLVDTQRSYYMVNEPLSWENGISACIHRYTTHVGVQADNRTSIKSYFFCGNDLMEHSVKLEDSACEPCVEPTERHCGGSQTLSLYKIRDSTPLVIFLTTYHGVRLLEVDRNRTHYSNPIETPTSAIRVETLYSKDEIVFQNFTGGKLSKSFFGKRLQKYSTPSKVGVNSSLVGFTVDWLHEQVYFCEDNRIMEYDMTSETTRNLYIADARCEDLAIDPYTRTLFTVFLNGTLSAFSLLTQNHRIYRGGEYGLQYARRVAVDCVKQLVYVITSLKPDRYTKCLVQLDYNDTSLTILYKAPKFEESYGLDVFKDTVIWDMGYSYTNSSIYSCKPSPTCKNMKLLYTATEGTNDINIYHPVKQTPTERFLCKSAGCSHKCTRITLFTVKCTCPEGLIIGSDHSTCQEPLGISSELATETLPLLPDSLQTSTIVPTSSDHSPKINCSITIFKTVLVSLLFITVIALFLYLMRCYSATTDQPLIELRAHGYCDMSNLLS